MNDDQIHCLILARNQEGLKLLIDRYGGLMMYIAKNTGLFEPEELAECISDTLLTIWNRAEKYDKNKTDCYCIVAFEFEHEYTSKSLNAS